MIHEVMKGRIWFLLIPNSISTAKPVTEIQRIYSILTMKTNFLHIQNPSCLASFYFGNLIIQVYNILSGTSFSTLLSSQTFMFSRLILSRKKELWFLSSKVPKEPRRLCHGFYFYLTPTYPRQCVKDGCFHLAVKQSELSVSSTVKQRGLGDFLCLVMGDFV